MAELYFLVLFWYRIVVSMLIVSEINSCVSVLVSFLVPKTMYFTFSQPLLGCMELIAISRKLLLATIFVFVGAAKNCFICYFALAANLQHFVQKTFF